MNPKHEVVRTPMKHPVRLASDMIREELKSLNFLGTSKPCKKAVDTYLCNDIEILGTATKSTRSQCKP